MSRWPSFLFITRQGGRPSFNGCKRKAFSTGVLPAEQSVLQRFISDLKVVSVNNSHLYADEKTKTLTADNERRINFLWSTLNNLSDFSPESRKLLLSKRIPLIRYLSATGNYEMAYKLLNGEYDSRLKPSIKASLLLRMNKLDELDHYLKFSIRHFSLDQVQSMLSALVHCCMQEKEDPVLALKIWCLVTKATYGKLCLTTSSNYKVNLRRLEEIIPPTKSGLKLLVRSAPDLTAHDFSMLLTTYLFLLFLHHESRLGLDVWKMKDSQSLSLHPMDLTVVMKGLVEMRGYDGALKLFNEHPNLHDDSQFDILLSCYGEKTNWTEMQKLFEGLFGRGELPNLVHYGIVMHVLADRSEVESVELLYSQLQKREMAPSINVMTAMMKAYIRYGDYYKAIHWFMELRKMGIIPNSHCYELLMMAMCGLRDSKKALGVLLNAVKSDAIQLSIQAFLPLLRLCAKLGDKELAKRLFSIISQYGLVPNMKCYEYLLKAYIKARSLKGFMSVIQSMTSKFPSIRQSANFYNIIMNYYLERGQQNEFTATYEQMVGKNISPNRWSYALLIRSLVKQGKLNLAVSLMEQHMNTTGQLSIASFNAVLRTLCDNCQYDEAIAFFPRIKEFHLEPSITSFIFLVKALSRNKNIELKSDNLHIVSNIFNDLVHNKNEKLLKYPKLNFPTALVKDFVFQLCSLQNTKDARANLNKFLENSAHFDPYKNISVLQMMMTIYGEEQNWEFFQSVYGIFLNTLKEGFFENSSSADKMIPFSYKKSLDPIWKYKLEQMAHYGDLHKIQRVIASLFETGYRLNNDNWNLTALKLLEHAMDVNYENDNQKVFETALGIIDSKLIGGFIGLQRKAKYPTASINQPKVYLTKESYMQMATSIRQYLETNFSEENARTEYVDRLREKFPSVMKRLFLEPVGFGEMSHQKIR